MTEAIFKLYAFIFARKEFVKFNKFIYLLSLRGLGVLNYQSEYLMGERIWLKRYLKNRDKPVVLDIGANIGRYSSFVLGINNKSLVFAFEPHPRTFQTLIENVNETNFNAYNLAIGEKNGILELYDYASKDGSEHATLYKDVILDFHKDDPISHTVDVVKLDTFLKNKNIDIIDLLKIDVEGNEFKVLLGIQGYLKENKIKAIHFEFNSMNIVSKTSFKDFWDLLNNYNLYRILPGGGLLEIKSYSSILCEIYAFQNIIAILKTK